MKKNLVLIALMLLTSIGTFAQSSLIATLSHEGQIKAFYGGNALYQAHQAAVAGDIITLSGGSFSATTITKAITLRGAGMFANLDEQTYPTNISGPFYIEVADTENRLILEGLNFLNEVYFKKPIERPYFQKCKFKSLYSPLSERSIRFGNFINCYISEGISGYASATFINSYINNPTSNSSNVYEFTNCVIGFTSNLPSTIQNSTITNSVFVNSIGNTTYYQLSGNNTVYGCIATGNRVDNFFKSLKVGNNKVVTDITKVFKEFTGTNYSDDISFELTDDAATTYLGTDSTQVGMFGGPLPFDPSISTLKITKCNVASKSTVDGKLSVDIEVSGVE